MYGNWAHELRSTGNDSSSLCDWITVRVFVVMMTPEHFGIVSVVQCVCPTPVASFSQRRVLLPALGLPIVHRWNGCYIREYREYYMAVNCTVYGYGRTPYGKHTASDRTIF